MRLVSYRVEGTTRAGVVVDGNVFDVQRVLADHGVHWDRQTPTLRALLEDFGSDLRPVDESLRIADRASAAGGLDELDLAPPIVDPEKILCIGLNYRDHVAETGRALPEFPDVFTKFSRSLVGPNDVIGGLESTEQLDFEGELAIVIGREGRGIASEDALEHVAGVMILNDITARDIQYRGTQWVMGKSVDGSTPSGPELVTLDEIEDIQSLEISTRVNGAEMQRSNTRHMIFTIADIVAYLSCTITLAPGDIIATGTPDGIGAKRTPPVWLRAGDEVEVELEGVGVLRSIVAPGR